MLDVFANGLQMVASTFQERRGPVHVVLATAGTHSRFEAR